VTIEAIPGALTADRALGRSATPGLLRELGGLLASLHNAGVDQGDLHGGNALVDAEGVAWGIDFHGARLRSPGALGIEILGRDLAVLCASHRERLSARQRARFFLAWRRALSPHLASALDRARGFLESVELRGKELRFGACAKYAEPTSRWFRESGSCRCLVTTDAKGPSVEPPTRTLFARRDIPSTLAKDWIRIVDASPVGRPPQLPPGLWLLRTDASQARQLWGRAARLSAHGLPGPRPAILSLGAQPWVLLEFAPGPNADAQSPARHPIHELTIAPTSAQFAALDSQLEYRGLALARGLPAAFWQAESGQLCLSPHAEFVARKQAPPDRAAKHKRRDSRQKLFRTWPHFQAPLARPFVNMGLHAAAASARFSPLQSQILSNLEVAYPGPENRKKRHRTAAHVRHHMARLAAEWGRLGRGDTERDWLQSRVTLDESVAHFDELLARGRGVLIVAPHLGNWELLAPTLVARGCRGAVVGRRRLRDPGGALLEHMRAPWGFETLPQDGSPREILRRLRDGQVIGILPDLEVPRLAGIRLPFLNKEALVMTAPAALARAAKVPLLPATCVLDESTAMGPNASAPYRIHFGEPIARGLEKDNEPATLAWISVFEEWIHRAPSQWIWYQDRWRTPPSAADAVPLASLRAAQKDSKP
jgi:KDO2-lipid IV(A) lauroyltransferase